MHDGYDLRHLLSLLRARWKLAAGMTALAAATLVAAILWHTPDDHVIRVVLSLRPLVGQGKLPAGLGGSLGQASPEVYAEKISSFQFASAVSEALAEEGIDLSARSVWKAIEVSPLEPERGWRETELLEIRILEEDPALLDAIAEQVVVEVLEEDLRSVRSALDQAGTMVERFVQEAKLELTHVQDRTRTMLESEGLLDVESRILALTESRQSLEVERTEVAAELRSITDRLGRLDLEPGKPIGAPLVLENPRAVELRSELLAAEAALEKARTRYTPAHPKLHRLEQELEALESALEETLETSRPGEIWRPDPALRAAVAEEIARLRARRDGLRSKLQEWDQRLAQLSEEHQELARRKADVELLSLEASFQEQRYRYLLERREEIRIRAESSEGMVQVVDRGIVEPTYVRRAGLASLALLLSLGLGLGVTMTLEWLSPKIRSPRDLLAAIPAPVLATIPHDRRMTDLRRPAAEPYRALRSRLQAAWRASGAGRSLQITSARAGEGKTTLSLHLARAFARAGSSVLLVDADLRNPSLSRILDAEAAAGLVGLARGENLVLQDGPEENIRFLAAGSGIEDPEAIFESSSLRRRVQELSRRFDVVLWDGPPILEAPEALGLAFLTGEVLVVCETGRLGIDEAETLAEILGDLPEVRLRGTVLHGSTDLIGGYRYGYGYGRRSADPTPGARAAAPRNGHANGGSDPSSALPPYSLGDGEGGGSGPGCEERA